jgi:hypothetical protein
MLAVADRQQGFFDAGWCSGLLPEDSIHWLLAQRGDRIVRDEDLAGCYSEHHGGPSIPPSLLAKVLLLAYRDGLSDERAMEAVRFDLRWKVALDLPIDHPGFRHPTSPARFRARLLLQGKERLVFERSLELATELGLIEGGGADRRLDPDAQRRRGPGHRDARPLGVRKILDTVRAADAAAAEELSSALRFNYSHPRVKPRGRLAGSGRSHGAAGRGGKRRRAALRAVEDDDELIAAHEVAEAARLLREIVAQEFEVEDDELPRPRRGRRARRIVSAHDPELRHGRTTPARGFTGYKLHAAAATEASIVTAISLSPANEHDGHHARALVDQQPEQRRPRRLIGDTADGNVEAREPLEQARGRGARAGPQHLAKGRDDPKDEFAIHLETDTVTRPRGNTAPIYKPRPNRPSATGERVARFARSDCEPCPFRQQCAPGGQRDVRISRRRTRAKPRFGRYPIPPSATIEAHQAADRAPARTHRPPLPRAPEPLPRGSKISVPARLDRRPRQPPPDRSRPAERRRIGRADRQIGTPTPGHLGRAGERHAKPLCFSGLRREQHRATGGVVGVNRPGGGARWWPGSLERGGRGRWRWSRRCRFLAGRWR